MKVAAVFLLCLGYCLASSSSSSCEVDILHKFWNGQNVFLSSFNTVYSGLRFFEDGSVTSTGHLGDNYYHYHGVWEHDEDGKVSYKLVSYDPVFDAFQRAECEIQFHCGRHTHEVEYTCVRFLEISIEDDPWTTLGDGPNPPTTGTLFAKSIRSPFPDDDD